MKELFDDTLSLCDEVDTTTLNTMQTINNNNVESQELTDEENTKLLFIYI